MKIFVAGATGALGIPLVRELAARGHKVIGLTRSEAKRPLLEKLGAEVVVADALDEAALMRAVRKAAPDSVVHLLTAIPKKGPRRAADMDITNNLRIKGTEHLIQAAVASGAKRIVAESMIFVYGYGDLGEERKKEEDLLPPARIAAGTRDTVEAIRSLENQLIEANVRWKIDTAALRFGLLYGPDVPATESNLEMLRRRAIPVVRSGEGTKSWIHVNDAVSAIIAALESRWSGEVYNIADDEPVSYGEFLRYAAEVIGAPRPRSVPLWFLRLTAPYAAAFLSTRLNVLNEKAKQQLGWRLQFPNFREGLKDVASRSREKKAA